MGRAIEGKRYYSKWKTTSQWGRTVVCDFFGMINRQRRSRLGRRRRRHDCSLA